MWKMACFLSLVLSAVSSVPTHAATIQRKHRPWFSGESVNSVTPAKAVVQADSLDASVQSAGLTQDKTLAGKDKGHQVAQQAFQYKGTRYRYGGTTKKGMDCSGLVARVWADLKMNKVPRASASLYKSGKPVKLSELRPGDLVFFKNTYKPGVSHVGVYAGNNKFVHAASRRGVTVTKLSDPYYQIHYAGARRLY
jgi:cell wall-associated NlpC family hydrolase